jgi:membrane protease subunit (stomatin/prohibitin family)
MITPDTIVKEKLEQMQTGLNNAKDYVENAKDTPSVIKYEGDNTTFVWKHPCEDFFTGTQLIVHESQEALFYMNGEALDLFKAGRHMLETQNLPLVSKWFKKETGNRTPFHCEVYFINKTEQMAIKWGTSDKVEYLDPLYKFPLKIGASGEMFLRAENSRKLLGKVVGTENTLTQQSLTQKFRGFLMLHLKTYLSRLMREKEINIFQVDEHLTEMSDYLKEKLSPEFDDYGICLERFLLTTIVKPEEDKTYIQFRDLHSQQFKSTFANQQVMFDTQRKTLEAQGRQSVGLIDQDTESKRMMMEAEALAYKRRIEGYTYQDERSFDVSQKLAGNEAVAPMANMGIGLGMMAGVGSVMGTTVGGMVSQSMGAVNPPQANETVSGNQNPQLPQDDIEIRLAKLEKLKGKIPDNMYEQKLQEILNSI